MIWNINEYAHMIIMSYTIKKKMLSNLVKSRLSLLCGCVNTSSFIFLWIDALMARRDIVYTLLRSWLIFILVVSVIYGSSTTLKCGLFAYLRWWCQQKSKFLIRTHFFFALISSLRQSSLVLSFSVHCLCTLFKFFVAATSSTKITHVSLSLYVHSGWCTKVKLIIAALLSCKTRNARSVLGGS